MNALNSEETDWLSATGSVKNLPKTPYHGRISLRHVEKATSTETHKVVVQGVSEDVAENHPLVGFDQKLHDLLHFDAGLELCVDNLGLKNEEVVLAVSVCLSL